MDAEAAAQAVQAGEVASVSRPQRDRGDVRSLRVARRTAVKARTTPTSQPLDIYCEPGVSRGRSVMNQGFYALQVFVRGVLIRL